MCIWVNGSNPDPPTWPSAWTRSHEGAGLHGCLDVPRCLMKNYELYTYQVNRATSIIHLMYADDVLIFSKANPKSLNGIKSLNFFSKFSCLEVNNNESLPTFSKVCEEDLDIQDILGFAAKKLPISYLGFPITGKKKSFNQCFKLIQPIEALLSRWSGEVYVLGTWNCPTILND